MRSADLSAYLANQLDTAIADAGLTRAVLARRLGVTPPYVTNLLNGHKRLTMTSLAALLETLGLDLRVIPISREATP